MVGLSRQHKQDYRRASFFPKRLILDFFKTTSVLVNLCIDLALGFHIAGNGSRKTIT